MWSERFEAFEAWDWFRKGFESIILYLCRPCARWNRINAWKTLLLCDVFRSAATTCMTREMRFTTQVRLLKHYQPVRTTILLGEGAIHTCFLNSIFKFFKAKKLPSHCGFVPLSHSVRCACRDGHDRSQYCVRMRESPTIWVSGYVTLLWKLQVSYGFSPWKR